jgi:hypothetical protein
MQVEHGIRSVAIENMVGTGHALFSQSSNCQDTEDIGLEMVNELKLLKSQKRLPDISAQSLLAGQPGL